MGRPAQRTRGSVPENQFRRPRPDLHGGRLTEILEPLLRPWETSTAPAREEEHRAAGSPSTRPRWTIIREEPQHKRLTSTVPLPLSFNHYRLESPQNRHGRTTRSSNHRSSEQRERRGKNRVSACVRIYQTGDASPILRSRAGGDSSSAETPILELSVPYFGETAGIGEQDCCVSLIPAAGWPSHWQR